MGLEMQVKEGEGRETGKKRPIKKGGYGSGEGDEGYRKENMRVTC